MKAVIAQGLHKPLRTETVPDPVPPKNGFVLKVGRCGICGSDLHMTEDPAFGLKPGDILGHEFAGEVVELGSNPKDFKIGDLVSVSPLSGCGECAACLQGEMAWCRQFSLQSGGYAEFVAVTAKQAVRLPQNLSLSDGALIEPLAVALHGVVKSKLQVGDNILILGAGPIGLATAFWARRMGAAKVVIQDIATYQKDRAYIMGATDFITDKDDPVGASMRALGGSADIVFECVGLPGLISQAVKQVRIKGQILILGLCSKPDNWIPFEAVSKEINLQMSAFFTQKEYETALDILSSGALEPQSLISGEVSLENTPTIFEDLKKRTHDCKVLINPFA